MHKGLVSFLCEWSVLIPLPIFLLQFWSFYLTQLQMLGVLYILARLEPLHSGTPEWLSGWASAFSSGRDPRVLGLSPTLGSPTLNDHFASWFWLWCFFSYLNSSFIFYFFKGYLFERASEHERAWVRGGEKEKQAPHWAGSSTWAWSQDHHLS